MILPKGRKVYVSQALGGTVTVRAEGGLFRIAGKDLDALGEDVLEEVNQQKEESGVSSGPVGEQQVWDAMKTCYDPEIPINIVDLGLIYDLRLEDSDVEGQKNVAVKMTLTAQGCGMGPVIAEDAKTKIEALPGVNSAVVDIVWDPVWNPQMISEEGRKKLGING